jgi:Malectin domain/Bacterial protein of unknown function (DUF839)
MKSRKVDENSVAPSSVTGVESVEQSMPGNQFDDSEVDSNESISTKLIVENLPERRRINVSRVAFFTSIVVLCIAIAFAIVLSVTRKSRSSTVTSANLSGEELDGQSPGPSSNNDTAISSFNSSLEHNFPLLINTGGHSFVDNEANTWVADQYFDGGRAVVRLCSSANYVAKINDMDCACRIFDESESRDSSYTIPVPNGSYFLKLRFTEYIFQEAGQRIFDVVAEGSVIAENLDIYARAGGGLSNLIPYYTPETKVDVTDGALTIVFVAQVGFPIVSAIEIRTASSISTAPVPVFQELLTPSPSIVQAIELVSGATIPVTLAPNTLQPTSLEPTTFEPTIVVATYVAGKLAHEENGLFLSEGLTARTIAKAGNPVRYSNGEYSSRSFHQMPDAGAAFPDYREGNAGGWIYVSNSETDKDYVGEGGVGAITFDQFGNVIDYSRVLTGTTANCGGGRTPWGSWVSGEEYENGELWQVDPTGVRSSEKLTMGRSNPGWFESFAYDSRNQDRPRFFATKDDINGEIMRL